MRTFAEIKEDVIQANSINDATSLMDLAAELDELDTPQAEALSCLTHGRVLSLHGDHQAALKHFHRALALYEELGDRSGVAGATGNIGNVGLGTGDYPEALKHYYRSTAIHQELGNRLAVAKIAGNIGAVHANIGDYPAALEHYHHSLAILEELGHRGNVAGVTGNIGGVHLNTGDYPAALEHYQRALALHEELGSRSGVASVTTNIGNVYTCTGDYPTALEYFHRALALHEELGNRSSVALIIGNIGSVNYSTGDYVAALEYFNRALALHEERGERSGGALITGHILATHVIMGSDAEAQATLLTMDALLIDRPAVRITRELQRATLQQRSGDDDAAAITLQHALSEAFEHGLRNSAADVHKSLRDLALAQNNLTRYVEHNNQYTRITEEINGKQATLKMAMQAKQLEIDAREREHAKHMAVLHSTLPKHIADRVARGEVVNDSFDDATVLFLDVAGFTTNSSDLDAGTVVDLLQQIFTTFDAICTEHNVMKIKTIGDSYMAVAFPSASHLENLATVALAMQTSVFTWPHTGDRVMFRIGLHCGPVVAGVLGTDRMQYDVWGDTVNVASRMESTGEAGRVHVSEAFALNLKSNQESRIKNPISESHEVSNVTSHSSLVTQLLTPHLSLVTFFRGSMDIKGKGTMRTYWLETAQ